MNLDTKFIILFIWGIISVMLLPFENIFYINGILYVIIAFILVIPYEDIISYIKHKKTYKLNDEERPIWNSIVIKANNGYTEFCNQYDDTDICVCPWTQELSTEEYKLLNKIHEKCIGEGWYIIDPLGVSQINYIMYDDVKDKVI